MWLFFSVYSGLTTSLAQRPLCLTTEPLLPDTVHHEHRDIFMIKIRFIDTQGYFSAPPIKQIHRYQRSSAGSSILCTLETPGKKLAISTVALIKPGRLSCRIARSWTIRQEEKGILPGKTLSRVERARPALLRLSWKALRLHPQGKQDHASETERKAEQDEDPLAWPYGIR